MEAEAKDWTLRGWTFTLSAQNSPGVCASKGRRQGVCKMYMRDVQGVYEGGAKMRVWVCVYKGGSYE